MTKNNKNASRRTNNHQHDVTIETSAGNKKTISNKEWWSLLEKPEAKLLPKKLNNTVATATSAFWLAKVGDKLTEQNGRTSHFGFTTRPIAAIDEITKIFNSIDNMIFFAATNGECDNFNFNIDITHIDDNCLVSVSDIKKLNWMFKRVEFFCTDLIKGCQENRIPEFYNVELLGKAGIRNWVVPAAHVATVFNISTTNILIEDDGIEILFSKAAPAAEEIFWKSDKYLVVSVYDAIKNIMTDYYFNHLSEN